MEPLAEICADLVDMVELHIDGVDGATDPEEKLVEADAVCTYYQGVGICELLLDAETDAFFHHFIRSAQTRRWMLQYAARLPAAVLPAVVAASNTRGLFAAALARQWGLAAEIARLSPAAPAPESEYEDDFCYARFLHLQLTEAPAPQLESVLDRFATIVEGASALRLELCRGLLARDAAGCAQAFDALVSERAEWVETARKESAASRDSLFRPFSAVYVEGLAWLALLERAGIPMDGEYRFCPSMARVKDYAPFEVSTFPSVPI